MPKATSMLKKVFELLKENKKKRVSVEDLKKVTKKAACKTYYYRCITYLRNYGFNIINKRGMYKMM